MKIQSIVCRRLDDDVGSVTLEEVSLSAPGPGEVQVAIMACSVNFTDVLTIQGKYQHRPHLPFTPGGESAGVVAAVGAGVGTVREGDAVILGMRTGGFSERCNVPEEVVRPLPRGMSFAKAAVFQSAYMTARVALHRRGRLEPGETLLVHGATGGMGMAAADLGKRMGATVIATGSRDDKLAVVRARGADHVINHANGDKPGFRDAVRALTAGRGADVVFDPVGGDLFDESMRCMNWDGRVLTVGFTSGRWPLAKVNHILIKHISVIGVRAGEYAKHHPVKGEADRRAVCRMAENGTIDPHICAGYPLARAAEAMQLLVDREVVGKAVVTMNGYTWEPESTTTRARAREDMDASTVR